MNPSLFIEYIDKYFRLVIGKITEKINGTKRCSRRNTPQTSLGVRPS